MPIRTFVTVSHEITHCLHLRDVMTTYAQNESDTTSALKFLVNKLDQSVSLSTEWMVAFPAMICVGFLIYVA